MELASLDPELRTDALEEVWGYAVAGSSKQTRSRVLLSAETAARSGRGEPCADTQIAAAAVEMFHLATLPHDDVMDDSGIRRGVVSLPARYGAPVATAAGSLFFGRALTLFARCGQDAVTIAVQAAQRVCEGQMLELQDRHNTARTPERHLRAITGKTAGMFRLAAELGALLGNADETARSSLEQYGTALGVGFQLIDDVLDFTGNQQQTGKQCGNDLSNGNYTLPVIYALQECPEIGLLLREDAETADVVNRICATRAIARASADAQNWMSRAKDAVHTLPEAQGLLMAADAEIDRLSVRS